MRVQKPHHPEAGNWAHWKADHYLQGPCHKGVPAQTGGAHGRGAAIGLQVGSFCYTGDTESGHIVD